MSIIQASSNEQLISYFTDIDIGVVTALQTELDALINLATKHETIVGQYRTYHKLYFTINRKDFTIIAHTLDRMGISSMAITLMEILYGFPQLKYIALIGIAAGSDSKNQNFGDILIPSKIYNYESGKYIESAIESSMATNDLVIFKSDYSSFDIDPGILQKIAAVSSDKKIVESIQEGWPQVKSYKLRVHTGNFACGSAVIASKKKVDEIEKAISRKYVGMDMETFALASVNQLKHSEHPKMFIIKSITDFADTAKDDSEQAFAAFVSAKFFLEVCSHVFIQEKLTTISAGRMQPKITISSATYEWPDGQIDVKEQINALISKGIYIIIVDPSIFGIRDPAWGIVKNLKIDCIINGKKRTFDKKDGERFKLE